MNVESRFRSSRERDKILRRDTISRGRVASREPKLEWEKKGGFLVLFEMELFATFSQIDFSLCFST